MTDRGGFPPDHIASMHEPAVGCLPAGQVRCGATAAAAGPTGPRAVRP
jgi:hypothetical protein